jgi:signal transduction histidine kinase
MQGTDDMLLQRISDLEIQNQMLEAFSGAVAHNLKGLLYHIAGYARTLRDVHAALPDVKLRECLDLMHDKARETLEIMDDLLFLSGADLEMEALATGKYGQVSEPALEGTLLAEAIGGQAN